MSNSQFTLKRPPQNPQEAQQAEQVRVQNLLSKHLPDAPNLKCKNCENTTFHQAVSVKRISKIVLGTQADAVIPYQVFVCTKCNETFEIE